MSVKFPDAITSLTDGVRTNVKSRNAEILSGAVDHLVNETLQQRRGLLLQALPIRTSLAATLAANSKPDKDFFDNDNNLIQSVFSKERKEAREKAQKALDEMDTALNKAIDDADWEPLTKLLSKQPKDNPEKVKS